MELKDLHENKIKLEEALEKCNSLKLRFKIENTLRVVDKQIEKIELNAIINDEITDFMRQHYGL